jgi:outer membrane protein TolC
VVPEGAFQGRLGVAQAISLADLGGARRGALGREADALGAERAASVTRRRVEASTAWLELDFRERAHAAAVSQSKLASELARLTKRGLELGELTRVDAGDASAWAAEAELAVLDAEGSVTEARLTLAAALSLSGPVSCEGAAPDFAPLTARERDAAEAALERMPSVRAAAARVEALRARDVEARASYAPQLTLGAVVDRTTPSGLALVGTLGLSLPASNRGGRERASLAAERLLAEGQHTEEKARAGLVLARALHEAEHADEVLRALDRSWLPALAAAQKARDAAFAAGESTALELITSRRTGLAARLRRERASTDRAIALAVVRELARAASDGRGRTP